MGATGTATVNFGGFPGSSDASVLITGQGGIQAGSLVEAWLVPVATSEHSADEHIIVGPTIYAGNIVPGTGFTIYGVGQERLPEPDKTDVPAARSAVHRYGRSTPMTYGQWSVAWVWN